MADTKCPSHPVDIPKDREIVEVDSLEFPWRQDPNGYFLVKLENGLVCCGFVNNSHKMAVEFRGTNIEKMIKEITSRKLVGLEHMGYIASELEIAKNCLESGTKYIQR